MKYIKEIIILLLVIIIVIILLGVYKFNYLSNKDGYDVDGNKIENVINKDNNSKRDESKNDSEIENNTDSKDQMMTIKVPNLEWNDTLGKHAIVYNKFRVSKDPAVLNAVYRKLFSLNEYQGKYEGTIFESVSIIDGIADVKLIGSWYPAGDMSALYFRRNIDASAFQYSNINEVRVYLNGEIFDWCVDDMSDGENGCPEEKQLWIDTRGQYNLFNA